MSRRLCIIGLALFLLLPAASVFADDDSWQIPDVGVWLLSLFDLDPSPQLGEKTGETGGEPPEASSGDGDEEPTDEAGMFGEPNG